MRASELINIKLSDIDLDNCQIKITKGKGKKDRIVSFPKVFMEVLAVHMDGAKRKKPHIYLNLFEKNHILDRGIRKIMQKYTEEAGIEHSISPHKLRHFLFTWLKRKGVDDALIQPYSGHQQRSSLEVYSKLSLSDCQEEYDSDNSSISRYRR